MAGRTEGANRFQPLHTEQSRADSSGVTAAVEPQCLQNVAALEATDCFCELGLAFIPKRRRADEMGLGAGQSRQNEQSRHGLC